MLKQQKNRKLRRPQTKERGLLLMDPLSSPQRSKPNPPDTDHKARWTNLARRTLDASPPASPTSFLRTIRSGSGRAFSNLYRQLRSSSAEWIVEFLRLDGLGALVDSLQALCEEKRVSVCTAYCQLECVRCVKKVMESKIGLDYIVENKEYTQKLAAALDTNNVTVKKQVLELLSALCMYNNEGYSRTLEALENYKELKGERYRMKIIVEELRSAQTNEYKTTLMGFINCLVINSPSIKDRVRIRNEFIGLKLLEVVNRLRQGETVEDLSVQLDVFDDQRYADEPQLVGNVDLSSAQDVFYAILRQVAETPQEIPFLNILQHLLRIDTKDALSDIIWDTAETLVHRATLLECREDSKKLLRSPSHPSLSIPKCQCQIPRLDDGGRRRSLWGDGAKTPIILSPTSTIPPFSCQTSVLPPLPLPPLPPPLISPPSCPTPPPPPPPGCPPPPPPPGCPPPPPPPGCPPPPPFLSSTKMSTPESVINVPESTLPQMLTPKPKSKMKSLNWNKLPSQRIIGKNNIWTKIAERREPKACTEVNFDELEDLFCQQQMVNQNGQTSPQLGRDSVDGIERRRKDTSEINLLDGKRSLNVNIFLKQFRSSNEDIINLIKQGAHEDISAEKLRGLTKILPEADEAEMLRSFDGDRRRLGNAEKFLLQLLQTSNFKLRIEGMLLKEEFSAQLAFLEPAINAMILAADDLKQNHALQEVLFMVLVAGNFLNSGGYAGNAAGIKLSCLQKLTDIRANKPGMNLLHFVARQARQKDETLLKFSDEMQYLEDASKTSIDQLCNEIKTLDTRVEKMITQVNSAEFDIREQMQTFLSFAQQQLQVLHQDLVELEAVRVSLAEFCCEDLKTFRLEECFKTFHGFCVQFRNAVHDNERRRIAEEKAEARRKQREEQITLRRRISSNNNNNNDPRPTSMSGSEGESNVVDSLLTDIRNGFAQRRDSGSFKWRRGKRPNFDNNNNNNNNGNATSEDEPSVTNSPLVRRRMGSMGSGGDAENSPDVTPNGTVRRRRSRNRSGEDEGDLLDYLRLGANDSEARDRRSWGSNDGCGSLERSANRRSRRKRPDLFAAEFDRERPASPAPPTELPAEEETKPKQWRQKIEAWLQENEREEEKNHEIIDRRSRDKGRKVDNVDVVVVDSSNNNNKNNGFTLGTVHEDASDVPVCRPKLQRLKSTLADDDDGVGKVLSVLDATEDKSQWRKSSLNCDRLKEMRAKREKKAEDERADCRDTFKISIPVPGNVDVVPTPPSRMKKMKGEVSVVSNDEESTSPTALSKSKSLLSTLPTTALKEIENDGKSTNDVDADEDGMGVGQFDRFATLRQTRRYRRPEVDATSSNAHSKADAEVTADKNKNKIAETVRQYKTNAEIDKVLKVIEDTSKELKDMNSDEIRPKTLDRKNSCRIPTSRRPSSLPLSDNTAEKTFRSTYELRTPTSPTQDSSTTLQHPKRIIRCPSLTEPPKNVDKPTPKLIQRNVDKRPLRQKSVHSETEPEKDEGFEETQSLVSASSTQTCDTDQNELPTKKIIPKPIPMSTNNLTPGVTGIPQRHLSTSRLPTRSLHEPSTSRNSGLSRQFSTPANSRLKNSTTNLSRSSVREPMTRRPVNPSSRSSSRSSLASSITTVATTRGRQENNPNNNTNNQMKNKISGYTHAIKALTKNLGKPKTDENVDNKKIIPKITIQREIGINNNNKSISKNIPTNVDNKFKRSASSRTGLNSTGSSMNHRPVPVSALQRRNTATPTSQGFMRATAASQAKIPIKRNCGTRNSFQR